LDFIFSPIINFCLGIVLMKCYPSTQPWSTARSDTTVILGSTCGLFCSAAMLNKLGLLEKPLTPPIYSIIPPNLGLCVVRTVIGMLIVYATRQLVKDAVLRGTCRFYGLDWKHPDAKRSGKVEFPYYYLTYFTIGLTIAFVCPLLYRAMGINRDYSYTEI
jgi:sphingosine-1-phosphate phosphatase 1